MRFGAVHKLALDSMALLGVLAVLGTGALPQLIGAQFLVAVLVAIFFADWIQRQAQLKLLLSLSPLLLTLFTIVRFLSTDSLLQLSIEFITALQIVRLLTRQGASHDSQIIVLTIAQFVIATVIGESIAFAVCFFLFLVVAPTAMVLSHLRREVEGNYRQGARDRTGLPVDVPRILRSRRVVDRSFIVTTLTFSLPLLVATALLFVLFPRLKTSVSWLQTNKTGRMVGFSDSVDLGQIGVLRSDPTVALRFWLPGQSEPPNARMVLRLRGTAYDEYNGRSWSRSQSQRTQLAPLREQPLLRPHRASDRALEIDLQPIDPPVLFLPLRAVSLEPQGDAAEALPQLTRGAEDELRYGERDAAPRGLRYRVWLHDGQAPSERTKLSEPARTRYLQLPPRLDPRLPKSAEKWSAGASSAWQRAKQIEQHLARSFDYDTASPAGAAADPLADFLYESRRGHCEFFSTAMVMLLRTQGIPARNVTGFVGGSYNRFGRYYVVREGDAHSWVEAFIEQADGSGSWVTFDPTPTAAAQPLSELQGALAYMRDLLEALSEQWSRHVLSYDVKAQSKLWSYLRDPVGERAGEASAGAAQTRLIWPLLLLLLLLLFALKSRWQRRTPRTKASESHAAARAPAPNAQLATALYRELERWLERQGLPRAANVTPLQFAENLRHMQHPLASEVSELTNLYLRGRFSAQQLSADEQRHFRERLQRLRSGEKSAERS